MGSTYSSIILHFVFAPKGRDNKLLDSFREELHKYITGIVHAGQYPCHVLATGSVDDHIHLLISMHPMVAPSKLMQAIKANSSRWINEQQFHQSRFEWQEGFGVFSHSISQKATAIRYVLNQREHHRKKVFKEEYFELLRKHGIEFNDAYVLEFYL
jgi:REP element-mobilizing transposase RayT